MSTQVADVVLHIDESLITEQLEVIENHIHEMEGVLSACHRQETPHLISVTFDPEYVASHEILDKIAKDGYHAELVGL